jgi:molybdate transport system substrate-binding protein
MNAFTKIFVPFAIAMALLIACAPAPTPAPTAAPPTAAPVASATTAPTTAPTVAQPTVAPTAARTTTPAVTNGPLTVFAAASLTASFGAIGKAFEAANPGTKVTFNFAGSQALRTQIEQGAKPDVFASADTVNMDPLKTQGLVVGDTPIFTRNRLVVIAPKDNPAGVKALKDLTKPGLKLDIADASVPVGNYMLQSLDKLSADANYGADFKTQVLARVVSKENDVKQVVAKVSLGEADAGVVYTTDAQAAIDKLVTIEIPDQFNAIAVYPIAVAKTSANAPLAQKFIDYVLSADGQAVMKKYGFAPR